MAFQDVMQPETFEERAALARRMLEELQLDVEVWVDDLGDSSRAAFGDLPSWAVMLSSGGTIRRKIAWPDPDGLRAFTKDITAAAAADDLARRRRARMRNAYSLKRLDKLSRPELYEGPRGKAGRLHARRAHLAFLVEAAPEHPEREEWLSELTSSGPPHQREWARRQTANSTSGADQLR